MIRYLLIFIGVLVLIIVVGLISFRLMVCVIGKILKVEFSLYWFCIVWLNSGLFEGLFFSSGCGWLLGLKFGRLVMVMILLVLIFIRMLVVFLVFMIFMLLVSIFFIVVCVDRFSDSVSGVLLLVGLCS